MSKRGFFLFNDCLTAVGCLLLGAAPFLAGCHSASIPTPAHEQARAEEQAVVDHQRELLAMIPPPSKTRYMAIRTLESWQNPSITVQPGMLELHVLEADPNPSTIGAGGMLRPESARKQVLTISLDKLGNAISAIPENAWPYGRVLALEEAHKVPPSEEATVRRAVETTVSKLSDLGVIVYDPAEGNLR